ncbi:hypothetical protein QBC41DRAFT_347735 [Cercophora samala]|uniref:BTB domain-containing protein n=1 Tax=Cercophora samala TaxID=330535 RepID=A0AA39ZBF2_9PEZI|nr:hypothetical protein QBC41DRAFT_347735 [Cercophora samala]
MSSESIGAAEVPTNPVETIDENPQEAGNEGNDTAGEGVAPQTVEDIDEDGDLVLHVGPAANRNGYRIDSATLRRASEVFKAWFSRWIDNKPVDGSQWVIDLPDDNPTSFKVLLHIVHGQFEQATNAMAQGDGSMLHELLVLCDKYDMARMIKPWASAWLDRTINDTKDKPSYWKLVFVAWELGRYDLFTESCQHLILISERAGDGNGLVAYGRQLSDCRLGPSEMEERFRSVRYATIQALLDFYHSEVKSRLLGNTPTHRHQAQAPSPFLGGRAVVQFTANPFGANHREVFVPPARNMNKMCDQIVLGGIMQGTVTGPQGTKEDMNTEIMVLLPTEAYGFKGSVSALVGQITKTFNDTQSLGSGHEICHPGKRFLDFQRTIKDFTAECNKGWEGVLLRQEDKERLAKRKAIFS